MSEVATIVAGEEKKKISKVTTYYVGPSPAYIYPRGFMWNAGDAR